MSRRALAYAEDTLGVNRVWADTQDLAAQIARGHEQVAAFDAEVRTLASQIDGRRNKLLLEAANSNPEMTPTAFERHMKLAYAGDDELETLNRLHADAISRRESMAATVRGHQTNHNGFVARLNELGGYFNYLAAAKQAQTAAARTLTDDPWS